ncbi:hypothetical protein [Ralstonia pseudosolanacearum]|uniref:hypothetical protein n=1 Tax=Ralstonia pseudosolanacearum TaxID=1310165 RepID=UPI0021AD72C3|nr:hypothetical protein [Ralstonia pseudosolanacearum]
MLNKIGINSLFRSGNGQATSRAERESEQQNAADTNGRVRSGPLEGLRVGGGVLRRSGGQRTLANLGRFPAQGGHSLSLTGESALRDARIAQLHSSQAPGPSTGHQSEAAAVRRELLSIPSAAHSVPLPASLASQIDEKFVNFPRDNPGSLQFQDRVQLASTIDQLQKLRTTFSDIPVCFYPCGGADAFYPTLLSNAKITVMTGAEPWGGMQDVKRALNFEKTANDISGMGLGGGFDGLRDWREGAEGLGFNMGTLGPLAIARAIAAQTLNGESVSNLKISAFDIGEKGQLNFSKANAGNANNNHVAFWLTNSEGESRLYLYYRLDVDDAAALAKIANLHELLSGISDKGQTLLMEKGIPSNLYKHENTKHLLSPQASLIRAVVCDTHQNNDYRSQPVFLRDVALKQKTVALDKAPGTASWISPKFGYGDKVFIHTPSV